LCSKPPWRSGDGGDFHRVGQPGAKVVAGAVEENLSFVFETAKSAGMDHPVTVALVLGAPLRRGFGVFAAARSRAELGVGGEIAAFEFLQLGSGAGHDR
jgi:hypothetical protein